jgi:autotransporter-associated beta strand protein
MFLTVAASSAETVTWDGSSDFNWTNPDSTSWSGGTYDNGDDAQFLGSGAGTVTLSGTINPGSITVNSAGNYTFAGSAIGGTGTLTKDGTGTLSLRGTAANTYSGGTTIDGGTLTLGSGASQDALGSGAVTVNSGGSLQLWINPGGSYTIDNAFTMDGGTVYSQDGQYNLTGAMTLNAGGGTLGGTWDNKYLQVSGVISGSGALTIEDFPSSQTGDVILSASNNYSGGTIVNGGTLTLTDAGRIGGGGLTVNSGGTVSVANNDYNSIGGALTVNEGGNLSTDSTGNNAHNIAGITLNGGTLSSSGNTYSEGNWIFNGDVTVGGSALSTISGYAVGSKSGGGTYNVADSVAGSGTDLLVTANMVDASGGSYLTKTGAGTMTVTGAISYTGETNINGGVLEIESVSGWKGVDTSAFNINNGSTLLFTRNGGNGFVLNADDAINFGSSGGGTLDTNVASSNNFVVRGTTFTTQGGTGNTIQGSFNMDAGDVTFNVADGTDASDLTVSAVLGNAAGIVKQGAGTMELTGVNTYSGATTISAGTLEIGGSGQLDSGSYAQAIANNGTFNYNSSADQTLSGLISGSGAVVKDNSGNLTITASNTYSGGTTINGGTVILASGASEDALGSGAVTMNSGGSLQLWISAGGNHNIDNDFTMDGGTVYSKDGQYNLTGTMTLNVGGGTLGGTWSDKHIQVSGVISGAGGLTIVDFPSSQNGDVILSGVNTYTGNTTVSGGTLTLSAADNNIASSATIDVASGAYLDVSGISNGFALASGQTLSGAGTVTGDMTIALGSVLSPGNSPGTLSTGSQTWEDGGAFLWEINDSGGNQGADPGWDWLDITGTLDLSSLTAGGFTIDIDSLTSGNIAGDAVGFESYTKADGIFDYSFIIATASSGITGFDADNFTLDASGFSNAPSWEWGIVLSGSDLVLEAYAVPEPSSTALLGLGGLALAMRRKRN